MILMSDSSDMASVGASNRLEAPVVAAAAVIRNVRRVGAHSDGNMGPPFAWWEFGRWDGITRRCHSETAIAVDESAVAGGVCAAGQQQIPRRKNRGSE